MYLRPAPARALSACDCEAPTTFGTVIGFWPGERVTVTVLPFAACFFADGDCAVTTSAATLSL